MTGPSLVDALQPVNWHTLVLVSARAAGLVMVAPLWSLPAVPAMIRGAIAILLGFAVLPAVAPAAELDSAGMLVGLTGELLIGVALGLSAAVFLHGVAVAAEVVGLQMGLSLGAAFDPSTAMGAPGIGMLKGLLATAVYVTAGGHLALAGAFARSFDIIGAGVPPDIAGGGRAAAALAGMVFDIAVRVAAPAMAALLFANLTLALLNRAVPQLNTMMVAIPITVALGLLVLGASLPSLAAWMTGWTAGVGGTADGLVRSFAPASVLVPGR